MPHVQHEQLKILRLLARTQFASLDLVHKLTGANRKGRSTDHLLHEIENMLGFITHKVFYTKKKQALGTTYALTKTGMAYLAELEGWDERMLYYPEDGIGFEFADHFHRESCALFAARFWQWAEQAEDLAISHAIGYWKKEGSKYPANRVVVPGLEDPVIPDWVFKYDHGEKSRLLAVEVDRTTGRTRLRKKLEHYARGIDTQVIARRFAHPHAPCVLVITETAERMAQLVEDVRAGRAGPSFATDFLANFHLATIPDIEQRGLAGAFFRFDGSPSPLFA